MHRKLRIATLVATALLALAACGGGDEPQPAASPSGENHNEADVAFATEMIKHHAQALSMVDLTMDRPLEPEAQALAEDIRAAQAPEIETMTDWLQKWDEPIQESMPDHANAHDDGMTMDSDMPGMMRAEEMQTLENAPDAQFQDMWLEMMMKHHQGAVEMAQREQEDGQFAPAIRLAEEIESSQQAEIQTMQRLLRS